MQKKILIVGAGITGSTLAEQMAAKGYIVEVIEKRPHIAGNCYDYKNDAGILMNAYGAHLFHTNSERVWAYVQRFATWVPWKHTVIGKIGEKQFPIPVNIDTVNTLCGTNIKSEDEMKAWLAAHSLPCAAPKNSEEVALARVGPELYEAIFKAYTYKQWEKYPAELNPSVLERIPVRTNYDPYYFSDKYQALPAAGYTEFVRAQLTHPNITYRTSVEFTPDMTQEYDMIFYTGPIDAYYAAAGYPKLEYRSINFKVVDLDMDKFQSNSVVNYPSAAEPYTRIVEYKHFLNQEVPGKTTIVYEYTCAEGDPYYPIPNPANIELYKKYQALAEADEAKGIYFIGRLANYKYFNMDAAIENALNFADKFPSAS